ncbi:hypothetical protein HWB19_gp121 [Cronobacter phage vB_CsaP_009]|uniref:Uncharacterized protein n=1 Tax=Cronobacter phage vB_CsaP_009 TaxID=2699738 RepID=A0A679FNU6_9CAUD|nr:hypothetical protein HWB19_gp121 [Cronobacter phage vB_CsaP_009]BBU72767.1 hypothetical protein [Cronobacter phage vB_CsaP_009]
MIRYIVVRVDDPFTLCTFNNKHSIELFPTAFSALSFINSEVRDCDKSEFEVRELDLRGKIGDSFGGVV